MLNNRAVQDDSRELISGNPGFDVVKNSNISPVNKLAQKYCSANTHHESWTIIEDCLINHGRMIYVKDHI